MWPALPCCFFCLGLNIILAFCTRSRILDLDKRVDLYFRSRAADVRRHSTPRIIFRFIQSDITNNRQSYFSFRGVVSVLLFCRCLVVPYYRRYFEEPFRSPLAPSVLSPKATRGYYFFPLTGGGYFGIFFRPSGLNAFVKRGRFVVNDRQYKLSIIFFLKYCLL